ncbi:hypothetical protein YDYSG_12710 [Paenibacillus tyrfis]|uniref:basic secretory protein-like protein n=1 Tax=Paenibacillus tyrfis TaxID=1501230 RepID=UPI002492B703|nr:basic secretory protein-like protein [Paenibacillus tyrfis]GLI05241.1 hypothetical protein YDYSG_12710 [Paenibacillus tyrfis]
MKKSRIFLLAAMMLAGGTTSVFADAIEQAAAFPIERTQGGTVTSNGQSPADQEKEEAFDNLLKTKWLTFQRSGWLQYAFPNQSSYVITSYSITSANDFPERDPKDWTLKGSNNGTDWTVLDTRQNESFDSRFQTKTYNFSNQTAYSYYRLELSNHSGGILQLAEVKLFDAQQWPEPAKVVEITASGEKLPNEGKDKLNDGSSLTKWFTSQKSGWVTYRFDRPMAIGGYVLTSANDVPERDPAEWTLQASNDGKQWVTLDTRKGEQFRYRYQRTSYSVRSDAKYSYYKLNMKASEGNKLQLAEIEFIPKDSPLQSILPSIEIRNLDAQGNGKLFDQALPDAQEQIKLIILKLNEILYGHPNRMDVGPKKVVIFIKDEGGVAWAGGTPVEGQVTISSRHLKNVSNSSTPLRHEILGMLYHELTHLYQLDDNRYGQIGYMIEGMADAIRFKVGYHDRLAVRKGGTWKDGYGVTGNFFVWIDEHKRPGFLRELNQSLSPFDGVEWNESVIQKLTGSDVLSLWNEYQRSLPNP